MKNLFVLLVLCFVTQLSFGQVIQKFKYPPRIQKPLSKTIIKPTLLRADLVVLNGFQTVNINGRRCLVGYVKNVGSLASRANNTEIRISWRVDHEHWTAQERFVNRYIPALAPGAVHKVQFYVPDHEIRSNEGYGSNHVSFRYFVDNRKVVAESVETNNIRSHSLPILRN
jgi:hypothetical protein